MRVLLVRPGCLLLIPPDVTGEGEVLGGHLGEVKLFSGSVLQSRLSLPRGRAPLQPESCTFPSSLM